MVWRTAEKKIIGTVLLVEEKPPVPVPVIEAFLKEHADLKRIIEGYGKRSECVSRSTLEIDSKLSPERVGKHLELFKAHDVAIDITPEGVCGKDALRKFKELLEVEL